MYSEINKDIKQEKDIHIEVFNRVDNYTPESKKYFDKFEENIMNFELWGDQVLEHTIDHLVNKYGEETAKDIIAETLKLGGKDYKTPWYEKQKK